MPRRHLTVLSDSQLAEMLKEEPPLPGNRRQGPDLQNVGNRRSPRWDRLDLPAPRTLAAHPTGRAGCRAIIRLAFELFEVVRWERSLEDHSVSSSYVAA